MCLVTLLMFCRLTPRTGMSLGRDKNTLPYELESRENIFPTVRMYGFFIKTVYCIPHSKPICTVELQFSTCVKYGHKMFVKALKNIHHIIFKGGGLINIKIFRVGTLKTPWLNKNIDIRNITCK